MAMTSFSVDALQSQCLVGLLLSVRDVRDMCAPILEGGMYYKLGGSTRRSACDDAVLFTLLGCAATLACALVSSLSSVATRSTFALGAFSGTVDESADVVDEPALCSAGLAVRLVSAAVCR
ncbi:uncharacterized protein PHACADRAFT_202477 [Phanerochaete carnosa HHB-10118-sp]|uniref:Uncharacterized protein n=1 Tax=Phanerochaete carnosa (strain HHB-10118-sp) TaxID=650164 RepID=K5WEX4_PHACS|nr:uncharacterized protein PHACADRAFT_202477 [Phanerochaete carnosa HHB-10118-sp]EKM48727.1 hypothetical protein PHACADRAFT_202477 [Phanerochaete carnosa HHB-10118-sp]